MTTGMRRARLAAAVLLLCSSTVTHAFTPVDEIVWPATGRFPAYPAEPPGRPVQFSVYSGLMHDNNLFRLSDTAPAPQRSDNVFRLGAGIDADLPVSRQRFILIARIEHQKFDNFDFLDHTAYQLGGTWRWAVGNDWGGDVGYERRHYLTPFGDLQAALKDMLTTDRAFASAGYALTARWRVRGGLEWWNYEHGDPTRAAALDMRTASVTGGVDYVTPAFNSVGGQMKYTEGRYENLQPFGAGFVDPGFREYEVSVVAHWVVTGKSTLDGRIGYTRREHEQLPQRDFSGPTWRLSYDWFVAAKTALNFQLWRETLAYADVGASYAVSTGGSFGPSWAPTNNLVLHGRIVRENREFKGVPTIVGTATPQTEDKFTGFRLAGGWTPRRNIEISVAADRGKRSSNTAGRDYDYTALMGNAKVRF